MLHKTSLNSFLAPDNGTRSVYFLSIRTKLCLERSQIQGISSPQKSPVNKKLLPIIEKSVDTPL